MGPEFNRVQALKERSLVFLLASLIHQWWPDDVAIVYQDLLIAAWKS